MTRTVAVVGAALAGLSAGRALRQQGFDGRVLLIGEETHAPYDRPPLSKGFLAGTCTRADLDLTGEDDTALGFEWMLGQRAVGLDPRGRSLRLADGGEIRADGVVLATGARARRLAGPGSLSGVHVLRSLDDAVALRSDLQPGRRLVVVGAGFIGAEVASTARGLGVDVTVVEALPVPLEGPLGPAMGGVCASLHADHGTRLLTGTGVAGLEGDDRVTAVRLLDGRRLPADVVVAGIGTEPNVEWLEGSGLDLRNGIATDVRGATSIPGVVAVGDCGAPWSETAGRHVRAEHWTHALEQPAAAVAALLGANPAPPHRIPYFWSDQYGVRIQFAGTRHPDDRLRVVEGDVDSRSFLALYERDEVPVAVLGLNQPRLFTRWRRQLHAAAVLLGATMGQSSYDYVIVGGGSAGSALANRLSADPANKVLVLEAGRNDSRWDAFIHMPAALTIPIGNPFYDWKYESEPEPHMGGRRIYHARGKVLGGSSSINGMIFQRGNPMDYERWAADAGMQAWDYAHCLPYFKRMENCLAADADDPFRGHAGPLVLERGPATSPLFQAFFAAVQQAGYPLTDDVNGYRQEGFAPFDRNIHRGRRLSAARAYLHPVMSRPNLTVLTRAFVTRVRFEGKRAVGVEYRHGREGAQVARAGEVILCGGAINSPQLLQLSGVGSAAELSSLGIQVVADLPGVGENLQDHLEVYIQHACRQPVSIAPGMKWWNKPKIGAEWLFLRKGLGATNHFEAGGFARSNDDVAYPNLMFHFLPIAVRYDGSMPAGDHGYQVHIGPMYSDARGSVKVKSADPGVKPAIRFNYLSTEQDRREWVEAIGVARKIFAQPAFAPYSSGEISPGPAVETPAQILSWVAKDAETALHPSCTAKMGTDPLSVVDPSTMRVHGLQGLRVVDASVMPYVTNGNIYAPVMMLAEKSADLILGNAPLAAEHAEFYRHRPQAETPARPA